ncbi:MAG: TIGR02452 family protein [Bradymonadia bacterium]
MNRPNRKGRAVLAHETLEILQAGHYLNASGQRVALDDSLRVAIDWTVEWPPDRCPPRPEPRFETVITVENNTTLEATRRMAEDTSAELVALNFASAKNPGGRFLNGSLAQEESLAMCSGLYACLKDQPMYDYHRRLKNPMYTDYAIYSPGVPVFRTEDGALLDAPYRCAFITSPAVKAHAARKHRGAGPVEIGAAMRGRVAKVLAIAAHYGHQDIVLGAWGCGVFRNDPELMASLFAEALHGDFDGVFRHVCFAILDRKGGAIINAFKVHLE